MSWEKHGDIVIIKCDSMKTCYLEILLKDNDEL